MPRTFRTFNATSDFTGVLRYVNTIFLTNTTESEDELKIVFRNGSINGEALFHIYASKHESKMFTFNTPIFFDLGVHVEVVGSVLGLIDGK